MDGIQTDAAQIIMQDSCQQGEKLEISQAAFSDTTTKTYLDFLPEHMHTLTLPYIKSNTQSGTNIF